MTGPCQSHWLWWIASRTSTGHMHLGDPCGCTQTPSELRCFAAAAVLRGVCFIKFNLSRKQRFDVDLSELLHALHVKICEGVLFFCSFLENKFNFKTRHWWEAGPGSAQGLPLSKLDLHQGASNLSMDLACLHLLGNPVQTCS